MQFAYQIAEDIASGRQTCESLVIQCLERIEADNIKGRKLQALISVCPKDIVLALAKQRDTEVRSGKSQGPLHGVPIVIKDAIVTGPELGMTNTAGTEVIKAMKAKRNSDIVDRLLEAGLIILGKSNMTELCGLKDASTPMGYSTVGGQTLSTFRQEGLSEKDQPIAGGSSSGSAVSIAAGFVPLAIGSETSGSNVFPASVSDVYGLTLSAGRVSTTGIWRISNSFDRIGVMAGCPGDLRKLAEVICSDSIIVRDQVSLGDNLNFKVGVLDPTWGTWGQEWKQKWEKQKEPYEAFVKSLEAICERVVYPLHLDEPNHLNLSGNGLHQVALYECNTVVKGYLDQFENGGVTDMAAIVQWNKDHAELAMPKEHPGQSMLEDCLKLSTQMTPEIHRETIDQVKNLAGPKGVEKVMHEMGIDLIVSNSDATLVSYAAWLGWPIATIPTGWRKENGQPCGVFVLARANQEDLLLKFMQAVRDSQT
ncbi:amidase signature domain-containing protein [Kockovaella imperatae]|uniref:Amidase signature domain-containing protein n=1 Tax=Kockovaella imperatae TaxID=4999 RepID=A0A1Y1UV05_9TREE|nr:amidase signature domain-containing protein [Kockovaella imperatae]ORX41306.1 amidase signature domain-containing protein [Kockovaella imperatae]